MHLSIVATLYRSAPYLEEFHARVSRAAAAATDNFELILVNDGSPDDSLQIAQRLLADDARIRIVDLARNFGHHKAMMTGLAHARGELVFLIDSDLEEEPELLPQFLDRMRTAQADVVYGVQQARRGSLFEQVSGWLFFKIFNLLSDHHIPPNLVTVRLMSRRYVSALVAHRERETMIAGLWALTGFRQVPQPIIKHSKGQTSYGLRHKVSLLVTSITSFSDRPLVMIFYLGLCIGGSAALAAVYLVIRRLFFGVALPGWPSLIVSVWMLGGLMLISLGIVGIYLSRIFIETKQRPYTIIRQIHERADRSALSNDPADGRRVLR
jgi:putative glycosyltransferase